MQESNNLDKLAKLLKNKKLIVALQRPSYSYNKVYNGKIKYEKSAGGVHLLFDALLKKTGGTMIARSSGNADKLIIDKENSLKIPPKKGDYKLKLIFLKKKEVENFYYGFANQTLWPLCHNVFVKPIFHQSWWDTYLQVNQKFAQSILEEIKEKNDFKNTVIWVNDYHLALLPKFLKEKNKELKVGVFWHIPWPTYEIFRICPWRKELLEGLLSSDFIAFHRSYHVANFIQCATRDLGVITDSEPTLIIFKDLKTKIGNLPAGIDYEEIKSQMRKKVSKKIIKKDFGFDYKKLILSVDRIDYTKGIIERLNIIDFFFQKYPQYIEEVTFLMIGAPSRTHIPAYKKLSHEINDLVEKINWRYSTSNWQPIHFINQTIDRKKIISYYQLADICFVTPLDDGMNLVAKEYVIACNPKNGMLILSQFAGAAKDLTEAILINPYEVEKSADALTYTLNMPSSEKLKRNKIMKSKIKENDIFKWAYEFLKNLV
jgi:trehalose 6-phosphate synthase